MLSCRKQQQQAWLSTVKPQESVEAWVAMVEKLPAEQDGRLY